MHRERGGEIVAACKSLKRNVLWETFAEGPRKEMCFGRHLLKAPRRLL